MSKQWQLRDKALLHLEKKIQVKEVSEGSIAAFRSIHKALIRTINDKVSNVFHTALQVLRVFIKKYAPNVLNREIHSSATEITSALIEKLGHSNVRTREASSEALMFLAATKEIGLPVIAPLLLKAPKSQAIWRPVLGRLQLLLGAVPSFGLQPSNRSGFQTEALMSFITQSFTSPNGEVRNAAVKVTTEVYKLMGLQVEKYLKGVKPLIREDMNKGDRTMCDPLQYSEIIPGDFPGQLEDMSLTNHKNDSAGTRGEITKDTFLQQSQPNSVQDSCELISPVMQHHGNSGRKLEETSIKKSPRIKQSMSIRASHESFSHLMRESLDGLKKDISIDSCIFCGLQDAEFTDGDKLDLHFCQRCPMLASCSNCRQIVEISTLKDHYLFECTTGKRYIECQKCLQAVPEVRTAAHLKSKECRPTKHPKITRCPLCNHAVKCSEAGWKDHLLKAPGCPKNPRNISAL
eukprot:Gb_38463 [translate_table: standard]